MAQVVIDINDDGQSGIDFKLSITDISDEKDIPDYIAQGIVAMGPQMLKQVLDMLNLSPEQQNEDI
ncbi:hypothetical protein [Kluyvera ascorbata]|uniref:hypothetical protein n=1 Tax=Kluyvera ascorbata TaxID=51288 RepID=UPI00289740DC|nr:hypothetical protein [Kluyvera ascorbata]